MTGGPPAAERAQPCRPYRVGEHSRALRNRLLVSMLIAVVIAAAATVIVPIGIALAVPGDGGRQASEVAALVTLPVVFVVEHWALIGPRRWAALELLIWASRFAAAGYTAATGIREPTDLNGGGLARHAPSGRRRGSGDHVLACVRAEPHR